MAGLWDYSHVSLNASVSAGADCAVDEVADRAAGGKSLGEGPIIRLFTGSISTG
jgi:hypothetical protein